MSRAQPQPDITFLNNFLDIQGKKSLENSEFIKRKLERIAERIGQDDWVQGQVAKASIDIHFNDYINAIKVLENALKVTNNESMRVWELYINLLVMIGDIEELFSVMLRIVSLNVPYPSTLQDTFLHAVNIYKFIDVLERNKSVDMKILKDYEYMKIEILQINKLNISLETYRKFISLIYNEFYRKFTGTLSPELIMGEDELVIRVGCIIDNAQDLFDLNNSYRERIMNIYSNVDENISHEFDKITVYFKHKKFDDSLVRVQ